MTSQSPAEAGEATEDYKNAWASIQAMAMEGNVSWSGREQNCMFMNLGEREFANVSAVSDADYADDSRAVARVDWDDDGLLDLMLKNRTGPRLRFLRNQGDDSTHWVKFDLRGTECNRDAIGATVHVEVAGRALRKTLHAGEGYLSQSSKRLHVGLAGDTEITSVAVQWPAGERETFTGVRADGRYLLVQGTGAATPVEARPHPELAASPSKRVEKREGSVGRIVLVERLPLEPVVLPSLEDPRRKVKDFAGKPLLVNLWESTCAVCLGEFGAFKQRRADLEASGVQLVTMSVDQGSAQDDARKILEKFGLSDGAGFVDAALRQTLEIVIVEVIGKSNNFELPTSLLFDGRGRLAVIYRGHLEVDTLLADVERLGDEDERGNTSLTGGRWFLPAGRDYTTLMTVMKELGRDRLSSYFESLQPDR